MKVRAERMPIGELVSKVKTFDPRSLSEGGTRHYIDIAAIDRVEKKIVSTCLITKTDAPSRARQIVETGDVLISTVRPNLNAVAQVPSRLDGQIASTGFTVLRPNANVLNSRYLFHWVRTPLFISYLCSHASGASYPAVTDATVVKSQIPLPPLDDQKRIAEILDQADSVLEKRELTLLKLDKLVESVYLSMFGDPARNNALWPQKTLGELLLIRRGGSPRPIEKWTGTV